MRRSRRSVGATTCLVLLAGIASGCGTKVSASDAAYGDPSVGQTTVQLVNPDLAGPRKPLLFVYHRPLGGEDACIKVDFGRPLSKDERSGVSSIVDYWYVLGDEGAFGIYLTGLFPQKPARSGAQLQWDVNTNLVGPDAYVPLARALHGYAYENSLPLLSVRVVDVPHLKGKVSLNEMCGH